MIKGLTPVLVVALVVLFAAGAIWGARVDPGKTVHRSPPTKGDEIPDYLMIKTSGILQPTILSPRDTILGYTTFDEQHDTRVLRMNALDYQDPAGLHFTFMRMVDTVGNYCYRSVDYTYWDTAGWYSLPAPRITPYNGSGYNTLELIRPLSGYFKSHSRAVVCYHTICGGVPEGSVILSIEPNTPGAMELEGAHYWYHIPDNFDNGRGHFPACAVDSLNRIHVAMHDAGGNTGDLGYVRCEERSGDKIMCWAPGKDSLIVDKETYYTDQSYEVTVFGKAYAEFQIVTTSKVSNKVALIWASYTEADPDVSPRRNDIFYIQSTNGGDDWFDAGSFPERINVTRYDYDDYVRAYCDLSAVYDMNDSLHLFWHTHYYDPHTKIFDFHDVTLWHWSKATEKVCDGETLIANEVAHAQWHVDAGSWNALISKMQSGVGYDPGLSNYNHLYVVWAQFDTGKTSQTGYTQGDIYVSVSTDGGLVWQEPLNVTSSTVVDCAPGECASDHYPSMAERVDTAVYLQWLYDLDAGGAGWNEGIRTNNPVLFYHLPVDSIPIDTAARIAWDVKSLVDPHINVPLDGQDTAYLVIENVGAKTLNITISSFPGWLSINPTSAALLSGGCPLNVELIATAGSTEEFKVDSIRIQSNDEVGNDDIWVAVHAVFSDTYADRQFAVVSNPMYYLSESNVGNLGHQNDTAGFYLYQYWAGSKPSILTDGSPILAFTSPDGDSLAARYIFDDHYFLPETELRVDTFPDLKTIVVGAKFNPVTPQAPVPWHHQWWWWTIEMKEYIFYSEEGRPDIGMENKSEQYIALRMMQLYYNPPPDWWPLQVPLASIPETYLGMALDIDCPARLDAHNTPFIDSTRRMAYLEGYDVWDSRNYYRMAVAQKDPCYEDNQGYTYCWPDPNTIDRDEPFGMHILRNDAFIYPQEGYRDDSLYKYMSTSGYSIYGNESPQDYNIVTTGKVISAGDFPPADTHAVAYALVVSDEQNKGKQDTLVDMVICGNANRDNAVTIGDVVYMVNHFFRSGPEIWLYMSDCNGDGVADIVDCVYLVSYLFKNGPPPKCSSL